MSNEHEIAEEQKTVHQLKSIDKKEKKIQLPNKDDPDNKRPTVILVGTKND